MGAGGIQIVPVSPGLFTANSNGQDVAAAVLFRLAGDGAQSYEAISQFDAQQNKFVPLPLDLGPDTDQVYLLLFGTGLRNRNFAGGSDGVHRQHRSGSALPPRRKAGLRGWIKST